MIWVRSFVPLIVLLCLWQAATAMLALPAYVLPGPLAALQVLLAAMPTVLPQLYYSSVSLGLGLASGILCAAVLAAVLQAKPVLRDAMMPIIVGIRVIPFVAIAPLIALLAGRDMRTTVIVVTISSIFPLLIGLLTGLSQAPAAMLELFHLNAATPLQTLVRLRIPVAVPYFLAGLRSALPAALLAVLIAEWLTGSRGLGFLILDAADSMQSELLWGLVTLVTAVSLFLFCAIATIEGVFLRRLTLPEAS